MIVRLHGTVQGVGFRWFIRQHARRALLDGWVRNDPGGTVSLVAEGDRDDLLDFLTRVKAGPPPAYVTAVQLDWGVATEEFGGFDIAQ